MEGGSPPSRGEPPARRRRLQPPLPTNLAGPSRDDIAPATAAETTPGPVAGNGGAAGQSTDAQFSSPRAGVELSRAGPAAYQATKTASNADLDVDLKPDQQPEQPQRNDQEQQEGDVPPCDSCPLCMHVLHAPVTTPCAHTFCGRCFRRWADVSNQGRNQWRRTAAGLAGFEVRGGGGGDRPVGRLVARPTAWPAAAATEMQVTCPLCRGTVPAELPEDGDRAEAVRTRHPAAYATRGAEIAAEAAGLAARRVLSRRLYVGNLHRVVPAQKVHNWTFFIRMDSEVEERQFIERVVVHLHPTFNPSVVVLTEPPFEVCRVGWGIFVLRAEVQFRERWGHPPLWVRWLLDFDVGNMVETDLEFTELRQGAPITGDADNAGTAAVLTAAGTTTAALPSGTGGGHDVGRRATREPAAATSDEGGGGGGGNEDTPALRSVWMLPTLRNLLDAATTRLGRVRRSPLPSSDTSDTSSS